MPRTRKIDSETRQRVLHEAGYHCANPACRTVLTLDIHHIEYVRNGGSNAPDNLLPLCPNCHKLHHAGVIPQTSIRAWKMLLLALNEAFDRRRLDLLLMVDKLKMLFISADSVVGFSGLLASGMVRLYETNYFVPITHYHVALTPKGACFVSAWKNGNQKVAIDTISGTDDDPAVLPAEVGYQQLNWGKRSPHACTPTTSGSPDVSPGPPQQPA